MDTLVFLALGERHPNRKPRHIAEADEVWTLNDFYRPARTRRMLGKRIPDRIYQIHADFDGAPGTPRFPQWEKQYREFARRGVMIVTAEDCGFENQRIFPFDEAYRTQEPQWFSSTLAYMFWDAIYGGKKPKTIILAGVTLSQRDLWRQGCGLLENVRSAREAGIRVSWPSEKAVAARVASYVKQALRGGNGHVDLLYGGPYATLGDIRDVFSTGSFQLPENISVLEAK